MQVISSNRKPNIKHKVFVNIICNAYNTFFLSQPQMAEILSLLYNNNQVCFCVHWHIIFTS